MLMGRKVCEKKIFLVDKTKSLKEININELIESDKDTIKSILKPRPEK